MSSKETIENEVKILEVLSKATDPMRPSDVGKIIGISQLQVGNYLSQLLKKSLVTKPDPEMKFYSITDNGREWMKNPPQKVEKEQTEKAEQESGARERSEREKRKIGAEPPKTPTEGDVPSQSDTFREFGERMGIGAGKEGVKLDAIMYYLGKTADFDDPVSIWNGLTEMGVDLNVRKRWLKLYLPTLTSKEIPKELKEKLESGEEKMDTKGKELEAEAAKPKFAVDENTGRIRAAREGEIPMTWLEAERVSDRIKSELKLQEKDTEEPPFVMGQDGIFAPNPKASKLGMNEFAVYMMYQESLRRGNPIDPVEELANREEQAARLREMLGVKAKGEESELSTLERMKALGLLKEGSGLAETITLLDSLGLLAKPGAGGETDVIKDMRQELANLRDTLAKKDMEVLTTELTGLKGVIANLRHEIELTRSSQTAKGEFDIMSQAIGVVDRRLGAIENTITGFFRKPPTALPKETKTIITDAIEEEVESEVALEELGGTLWGQKTS